MTESVHRDFPSTHWSLIAAAGESASESAGAALAELCGLYWYPVYAFVRRRGRSVEDARDLTQDFFATLLDKGYLADADPERGRFRAFLLTAVARFIAKERDKAQAQKRGGNLRRLSLDFQEGERRYQLEPAHEWTAERIFLRRWALTLLERTLHVLRQEHAESGKLRLFEACKPCLTGDDAAPSMRSIAEELAMSEGAVKVAVHRLRQKYRELLRAEISQTVASPDEIDDELRCLAAALRSG
jgi:RNA polymerase sigma factor (sigma-70 family)